MIFDFTPFIYLAVVIAIVATPTYFFLKLYVSHRKEVIKHQRKEEEEMQKTKPVDELMTLINNAPQLYSQIAMEYNNLKAKGATDQQVASLKSKMDMLKIVADNQEFIKPFARPIVTKLLGVLKSFG